MIIEARIQVPRPVGSVNAPDLGESRMNVPD